MTCRGEVEEGRKVSFLEFINRACGPCAISCETRRRRDSLRQPSIPALRCNISRLSNLRGLFDGFPACCYGRKVCFFRNSSISSPSSLQANPTPSEIASAVALPEPDNDVPASPENGLKRRKSSISEADSKRRRLSDQDDRPPRSSPEDSRRPPSSSAGVADRRTDRERRAARYGNGAEEERKRGQRLFGALLGTLSQSSSSPAQKRRADIERRQQAKLKQQDEEYDELKRKRREELTARRRKEQRHYEREAVCYIPAYADSEGCIRNVY